MKKRMGSLPNLHELRRDSDTSEDGSIHRHTAPIEYTKRVQVNPKSRTPILPGKSQSLKQRNNIRDPFRRFDVKNHQERDRSVDKDRIRRLYSNGSNKSRTDEVEVFSPMSSRSTHTTNPFVPYANTSHTWRRRESMTSSIGANSVRRLINGVLRQSNSHIVFSRQLLMRNAVVLSICHFCISTAYIPLLTLQSSISTWYWPGSNITYTSIVHLDVGSLLFALAYTFAAVSALFSPMFIRKSSVNVLFIVGYFVYIVFFLAHFYPVLVFLVPLYILMGITLGTLTISRIAFVMTSSSKLSCMIPDDTDDDDHHHRKNESRKICCIRRLARGFQAAHDLGLIFGSIGTAVLIANSEGFGDHVYSNITTSDCGTNCSMECAPINCTSPKVVDYYVASYHDLFDVDDNGDKICGTQSCPVQLFYDKDQFNSTRWRALDNYIYILSFKTSTVLVGIYLNFAIIAVILAGFGLNRIRLNHESNDRLTGWTVLRGIRDSFTDTRLLLTAPMAFFIGLEQGFMYGDFSKSYVVCSLGISSLNMVFLSMGLLQSIAAATLSMLLKTIRRYVVIFAGIAFQSLLILVITLWKPSGDDSAIFYVIPAAWGVCNAIWEMLNFTLLSAKYSDNWEAAYAFSFFFRYLGLATNFALHGVLCNQYKLYLLTFALIAAVVPYAYLEVKLGHAHKLRISRL